MTNPDPAARCLDKLIELRDLRLKLGKPVDDLNAAIKALANEMCRRERMVG